MNISELFIRRPVMTTLLTAAIFFAGIAALRLLPQSNMPNVDFPTIQVEAFLPGASPETMASSVATPLEKQFSTIAGIDSMNSTSVLGYTQVTVQFNLTRNIDAAAQDIQAAISKASAQLPPDMPAPPSYEKINPAMQPILYLSMTSDTLPLSKLDYYANTYISQRVSMLPGVAQVMVYGGQKYAVRIKLDPRAISAKGIGIDEVATAIRRANVNLPSGVLDGRHTAFTIEAHGQLENANAYKKIIVAYRGGFPVYLEDVAELKDSVENERVAAWDTGRRAIVLAIQRQPGTNTVAVVDEIEELLPEIRAQIPPSVKLETFYDLSESIKESIDDVKLTLAATIGLVILVIFLFLRSAPATVIPGAALLMSIIGTFAAMYFAGFSLDVLSMMALVLATGFVVDDAIVMLENIVRHTENREPPLTAALNGSKEIGFTIISMTLSLVVVFIPVLFMGGVLGKLLYEFAAVIGIAILISGFVALSLTPMLGSRFLRTETGEKKKNRFYLVTEQFLERIKKGYETTLRWSLKHRLAVFISGFVIFFATLGLFVIAPKGFIPNEDFNFLIGNTEAAQGISFDSMVKHQRAVDDIVISDPNVAATLSVVGIMGAGNSGFEIVRLKPKEKRKLNADQVLEGLRPKLAVVPGIRVFMQNPPSIPVGAHETKSPYQFTMLSPNTEDLYKYAELLERKMHELEGIQDISSDLQIRNPQAEIQIDRKKAAALGISAFQVEDALFNAYGTRQISTIFASDNEYRVILEVENKYQLDPSALSMLYVKSDTGQLVSLDTIAALSRDVGPVQINHVGQLPAVTVSFNLKPGVSLGQATGDVKKLAESVLPSHISTGFQGTAEAFQKSMGNIGPLFLMAVLIIYLVLGILYEDYIHPVTILSGLPSAGFGALLTLLIFRQEVNIYAIVGILMLIGIVKKNAIMMIDFAVEGMRSGKNERDAIFEGCLIRFRPIFMTSVAAFMGALPIALGIGAGAQARRPLGLAVCGGLLFSQVFTLYLTPVLFTYMEDFKRFAVKIIKKKK